MSWLQPSDYELALLENAQKNRADIVELAMYTALCPRIEPLLLRNMRDHWLKNSEPELEHHLWFSALVSARSTMNIVLHQGVARLLADKLQESTHFDKVWALTQSWTVHWSALDRLEQQLRIAALLDDQQQLNQGLQDILKRISDTEDKQKRLNLARWAKKTLAMIAPETAVSEEMACLAQYAATALGATAHWTQLSASTPMPEWLREPMHKGQSSIGLQLRYDLDSHYQVLECLAAEEAAMRIDLPTPLPARLYIQCDPQIHGNWEIIDLGSRIKIPQLVQRIELRTINGERYELTTTVDSVNTVPRQPRLYLAYVKEDEELAKTIAQELEAQHIQLTLIEEEPSENSSFSRQDSTARLLRLWTPTAYKKWSIVEQDGMQTPINSLLLRMDQALLPAGTNPAEIIDWDSNKGHAKEINDWLESGGYDKAESLQENASESLLKELENPETLPRRRMEIGDLLAQMGDPRKGVGVKSYEITTYAPEIQSLLDELQLTETEPPRRLEIGNQLAELGDPRIGVGVDANGLPLIDWVKIPAGAFIYGEDSKAAINLESFYISRYPMTNSQYQAFIDASGYHDERWWQDLSKPEPEEARWSQSNRPREGVDWYEAVAYTRWLSEQYGFKVSLPTEQQWEKAARGTDGRQYPWGNQFQSGFANIDETEQKEGLWYLQESTAVGCYPQGNSVYQLSDMAGNVWEWCLNKHASPEVIDSDNSGDGRVLRGGSWLNSSEDSRCALRGGGYPGNRCGNFGFRVVCLSPYTEH